MLFWAEKNGKKFEYKSYNGASINRISTTDSFLKQHLSYLGEATDINKILYEFDMKKFSDRDVIVEQFQKMYQKNSKVVFDAMGMDLKNSLMGKVSLSQQKQIFDVMINDKNSILYSFIKSE